MPDSLLDEVSAAGLWRPATKTGAVWARLLDGASTVSTLEGPIEAAAGDYLCRGVGGERWPQAAADFHAKYRTTSEIDDEGFTRFEPREDAPTLLAAQLDHPFTVQTPRGQLTGKSGDYLVKRVQDAKNDHPSDVWIVDQTLFEATYEFVESVQGNTDTDASGQANESAANGNRDICCSLRSTS